MSDPFMDYGGMTGGMAGSYCSPLPKWIASLACCIVVGLVVTLIIFNSQKSKARSELEACQRNKVSSKDENSKDVSSPTLVPAVVKTQNDTKKNNGQNKEKKNKGGKKKGGKKNKGGKNRREGFLWF